MGQNPSPLFSGNPRKYPRNGLRVQLKARNSCGIRSNPSGPWRYINKSVARAECLYRN